MKVLAALAAAAIVLVASARAEEPNTNCHKKKKWSDMMVCGNRDLTAMDAKVDRAYKKTQDSLPPDEAAQVRDVHNAWMRGREKCQKGPDPVKCLQDYYQRHIKEIVQPGDEQ